MGCQERLIIACRILHPAVGVMQQTRCPSLHGQLDELSSTPSPLDDHGVFTVTHPFHPFFGQRFPLLAQRLAWGEPRVFFHDPTTNHLRSLPTAWTDLAPLDPFICLAAGRALLRLTDLHALIQLLAAVQGSTDGA